MARPEILPKSLTRATAVKLLECGRPARSEGWRTVLFTLVVIASACSGVALAAGPVDESIKVAPCTALSSVVLGMEESALKKYAPQLTLDPYGCFGEKHQYMCKQSGVSIVVTSYKGVVKSVRFVAPPYSGFTRDQCLSVARAMLGQNSTRKEVEHDDADRTAADMNQSVEYFYFDDGARFELTFAKNSTTLVETVLVSAG
ncbi:MAG: hypothetical protein K2W95_24125 [Candidatus Obscuribacterales bacterium]|nr:hypothetical protein [Candidatus Obscuribacterales bacterium]